MIRKIFAFLTAAALSAAVLPAAYGAAFANEDIYGWITASSGSAAADLSGDYFRDGARSARLVSGDDSSSAKLSASVYAAEGKTYKLKFSAKAQAVKTFTCSIGTAKYSLTSLYKTYNWKSYEYEYKHTGDSGMINITFSLEKAGTAYIDDVHFFDGKTDLLENTSFEQDGSSSAEGGLAPNTYAPAEDVFGNFADKTAMPLMYVENIVFDGDFSEWGAYASADFPKSVSEVSTVSGYAGMSDLSARIGCAYNDEYFLISAEVEDDVHYPSQGSGYWRGDSIQAAIGTPDEDYGTEIGFYLDAENNPRFYSEALEMDAWGVVEESVLETKSRVRFAAVRSQNKTIYEIGIPWSLKFDSVPEEFLFNILVNDNDTGSRKGYIEWTEGIGKVKSNKDFIAGYTIKRESGVFGYVDGTKTARETEANEFYSYICNFTDEERDITASFADGSEKTVKLPGGAVYLMPFEETFDAAGTERINVRLSDGENTYTAFKTVTVMRDIEKALDELAAGELAELKALADRCAAAGIATDYENININTIEKYIGYGKEDLAASRNARAEYVYDCLEALYTETKAALEAYLDGSREPLGARYYSGGEVEIKQQSFYAQTRDSLTGAEEIHPVFFSGYTNNADINEKIKEFPQFGANIIQFEIPMSSYIAAGDAVDGWSSTKSGGVNGKCEYSEEAQSGSYSIKITNASSAASNVYVNLYQSVKLSAGKTYQFSFWAKASGANKCYFRPLGFAGSKIEISDSEDWKKYTYQYTPEETKTIEIMFVSEDITNELLIDNIRITEKGGRENLVTEGSFENKPVPVNGYTLRTARVKNSVLEYLNTAEANNVMVNILLSPHYFPTKLVPETEWQSAQTGFIKFNIYNPETKAVVEAFLKSIVPLIADHPALHSICISNEPTYRAGRDQYNAPAWHEYLRKLYGGDLAAMNGTWGESFADFDSVPLAETYENEKMYYDYLRFNDEMFYGWHRWMADIIKELAPDVPLHAKMMSVISSSESLNNESQLARGTDPELFAAFSDIQGNDSWNFIGGTKSIIVKELWYDLLSSIKRVPVFNSEDHVIEDGDERYTEQYAPHIATDIWQGAVHGRSAATIWKWERTTATTGSTAGNINHRPDAVALAGKTMLDLNRLSEEVTALQNKAAGAAVLYSYPSRCSSVTHLNAVYQCYSALLYNGVKASLVTEDMIRNGALDSVDMLILPDAAATYADVQQIIADYARSGKTVIMAGDGLTADEYARPLNYDTAACIKENSVFVPAVKKEGSTEIAFERSMTEVIAEVLEAEGKYSIKVIDNATGERAGNVEWLSCELDGRLLVNMTLYDWTADRNVSIYVNGVKAAAVKELRSGEIYGDSFELKPYTPALLEIEQ